MGYTLAVRADGRVLVWGNLMTGAATTPVAGSLARLVEGIANVRSVAAAGPSFSLALRSDGTAAGWGNNLFGALQQPLLVGSLVVTSNPVTLDSLGAVSQLDACVEYSIARRGDGSVWMLPASASTTAVTARPINGLANVARIERSVLTASMANCEFLAIDQAGAVKAVELTRRNDGSGGLVSNEAVRDLSGLPPVSQARCSGTDANNRFCVALDLNGRVWTMGGGGLLGDGSTAPRTNWAMLPTPTDVKSIAISGLTSFALTSTGAVHCWGSSSNDTCVAGTLSVLTPVLVPGLPAIAEVAAAGGLMAIANDGSVWGWGLNSFGEVNGAPGTVSQPTQVSGVNLN